VARAVPAPPARHSWPGPRTPKRGRRTPKIARPGRDQTRSSGRRPACPSGRSSAALRPGPRSTSLDFPGTDEARPRHIWEEEASAGGRERPRSTGPGWPARTGRRGGAMFPARRERGAGSPAAHLEGIEDISGAPVHPATHASLTPRNRPGAVQLGLTPAGQARMRPGGIAGRRGRPHGGKRPGKPRCEGGAWPAQGPAYGRDRRPGPLALPRSCSANRGRGGGP